MALKAFGIEDDGTIPGRAGVAINKLARVASTPEGDPVLKYFLDAVRNRHITPVKIVLDGSSTANGGIATRPDRKLVDRLSALTTKNPVRTDLTNPTATDIQWYEIANGGTQADTYVTATEVTELDSVNPTLMIHMIGSNDYAVQKNPATYLTEIRNVLNQIKAVSPNTRHIYATHQPRNDVDPATATYKWQQYVDQMWALAEENPGIVTVLDISKKFNRAGIPGNDVWGMIATDNVHLGDYGSKVYAHWLAEAMGIPTPPDNSEVFFSGANAAGASYTAEVIFHVITIPPRPYPREGTVSGVLYYRTEVDGTGTPLSLFRTRAGSGPNSIADYIYHALPKMPVGKNVTVPLHATFKVAPHEQLEIELVLRPGSGNTIYYSASTDYTRSWAVANPV